MKILVVVDMQKDFVDGALGTPEARAIVPNVAAKVKEYAKMENGLVVYTRDTHFADYADTREGRYLPVPHCIFETEGWKIVPEVLNDQAVVILNKETFGYSAIADKIGYIINEELDQEINSIEVCGLCTDVCVVSNALILKANFPDIPFVVDSACCAGTTPAKHEAALEVMRSCQIDVI
jgi:nicotinamidase-related amidase